MAFAVEHLTSFAELEPHRGFWDANATHRDGDHGFFREFAPCAEGFLRPHVLRVSRDGATCALLVGRLARQRLVIRFGPFGLGAPHLTVLTLVHGGLLGSDDPDAMRAAFDALRDLLRRGEADAVMLHFAPVGHPLTRLVRSGAGRLVRDAGARPVVLHQADLARFGADYLRSLSRNAREKQKQRERRLREAFGDGFRLEELRRADDVPRLMDLAERVMRHNYQRGLGVGFRHDETTRRRLLASAARGWLHGWVVWCGNDPAAFWIADIRGGILHNDFMGYDQRFGRYAPGTWLSVTLFQRLSRDGSAVRLVDLGVGDASWKSRLATGSEQVIAAGLFAARPRPLLVNLLRGGAAATTELAGWLLDRLGLREAVRRRLRDSGRRDAPADQREAR